MSMHLNLLGGPLWLQFRFGNLNNNIAMFVIADNLGVDGEVFKLKSFILP